MSRKRKRRTGRWIALAVVLALIAGSVYLFVLPGLRASATMTYDSYRAVRGTISNAMDFSGSVAVKSNEIFTAAAAAKVRGIYVSEEDEVKEGDRLMRLSTGETIKASFDGRVNEISVEEGDSVSAGANLIQIVDFNNLRVSLKVDEYDISNVYVGQACVVSVEALDLTFDSKLTHINRIAASSGSTAYYTVTAEVAVTEEVLPGMQVSVTIPREEAVDAIILNKDALSFDMRNSAYVLMENAEGRMEQVSVEIGVDNDNFVEIRSGLSEGDTVYAIAKDTSGGLAGLFGISAMPGSSERGNFDRSQMRPSSGGESSGFSGDMPGSR